MTSSDKVFINQTSRACVFNDAWTGSIDPIVKLAMLA